KKLGYGDQLDLIMVEQRTCLFQNGQSFRIRMTNSDSLATLLRQHHGFDELGANGVNSACVIEEYITTITGYVIAACSAECQGIRGGAAVDKIKLTLCQFIHQPTHSFAFLSQLTAHMIINATHIRNVLKAGVQSG